jgi:hypothetical protein
MPLVMISVTHEEIIDVFVNMTKVGGGNGLECFWRDTCKSKRFGIFQLFDCFTKLFPGNWIIEFPHGAALRNLGQKSRVDRSLGVVYSVKVRGKY